MPEKPLLSFILVTYNQEKYIREAVAGALAQTYSPLEIIVSDDCSPDRTFEIIQEMTAVYQGPHKVVLNRNEKNLRICGNLNKAVELSHGELIVAAAGDDISLPHRCSRIAEEWMKPGRHWHSLVSDAEIIDESGQGCGVYQNIQKPRSLTSIEAAIEAGGVSVAGCCHAFSRANYNFFGPIHPKAPAEDEILGFRSVVMGGIQWIPDVLLKYRRHDSNLYKDSAALKQLSRSVRCQAIQEDKDACALRCHLYGEYLRTAAKNGLLAPEQVERYIRLLKHRYPYYEYQIICKGSFSYAAVWLAWQVIRINYRRGMLTMFRLNNFPFGIRTTLWLRCRDWFRGGNPSSSLKRG